MSAPDHLPTVLLRGCEGMSLSMAARCAVAGYGVTVMVDDAFDAERLEHVLVRQGVTAETISIRQESDGVPPVAFAFSPLKALPTNATYCLCLAAPAEISNCANAARTVAAYFHPLVAEVGWGSVTGVDAAVITGFLAKIGFNVIAAPVGAARFAGVSLLEHFNRLADRVLLLGAVPWEIDEALEAIGFARGVFAAQDVAGLRPPDIEAPLLVRDRMVREGRLGRAVGVGWYRYPGGGGAVIDPLMEDMIVEEARFAGVVQTVQTTEDIQEKLMLGLACAGANMLAAGEIAEEASFGALAAQVLGAPDVMTFAHAMGHDAVSQKLAVFEKDDAALWRGQALLARLADPVSHLHP